MPVKVYILNVGLRRFKSTAIGFNNKSSLIKKQKHKSYKSKTS